MNDNERELRKRNYKALGDFLSAVTQRERYEFEVYLYSELIEEAEVWLTIERERIA